MNIVIGSAFRNCSEEQVRRYFLQVRQLIDKLGPKHAVRVVAAEGDSINNTRLEIDCYSTSMHVQTHLLDVTGGHPHYGSTEDPRRFVALSKVGNAIFDAVRDDDDMMIYVESDLIWDADTLRSLLDIAWQRTGGYDVVAPLVFAGPHFYDIWAFRKNGERFIPFPPYHIALDAEGITEVDSVGSCLVMRAEVARRCRIRNDYCLVGWCEDARAQGYRIGAHANLWINHPA